MTAISYLESHVQLDEYFYAALHKFQENFIICTLHLAEEIQVKIREFRGSVSMATLSALRFYPSLIAKLSAAPGDPETESLRVCTEELVGVKFRD